MLLNFKPAGAHVAAAGAFLLLMLPLLLLLLLSCRCLMLTFCCTWVTGPPQGCP
jgi:hypothetical protein